MPCPSSFGPACEQKVILGYFLMLTFLNSPRGFSLGLPREQKPHLWVQWERHEMLL